MPRVTKLELALREAFSRAPTENVDLALALIQGRYSDEQLDAIPAVVALRHSCYSEPWQHHKLMTALDSLLETHGCEYIGEVHMHDGPPVEYLNVGDSYTATVVWYRDLCTFRVQCFADAVEWCERRHITT